MKRKKRFNLVVIKSNNIFKIYWNIAEMFVGGNPPNYTKFPNFHYQPPNPFFLPAQLNKKEPGKSLNTDPRAAEMYKSHGYSFCD